MYQGQCLCGTVRFSIPGEIRSEIIYRPDELRVRIGAITSGILERPEAHNFVTSMANREETCGDLPHYESYEPGR
jgi:hypothetical protein